MTRDDVVVDVSQDWVLACDVQRPFMQGLGRTSDSVDYSARCRQVRALGGDCYDFMPLTNDRLALVVGDASGKGVAAALMIASVQSSLRTAALFTGNDPATLLKIVNPRHMLRRSRTVMRPCSMASSTERRARYGTRMPDTLRRSFSAKRFNRYARAGRRTCWYVS